MARDLYGDMLSRALQRQAPSGHFPAYITPFEAGLLRSRGGGVPPAAVSTWRAVFRLFSAARMILAVGLKVAQVRAQTWAIQKEQVWESAIPTRAKTQAE